MGKHENLENLLHSDGLKAEARDFLAEYISIAAVTAT